MNYKCNINELSNLLLSFNEQHKKLIENINTQYLDDITSYHDVLLRTIAKDYNLNFNELNKKYRENISQLKNKNNDLNILEKIIINDIPYFIENKENGKIYDNEIIIVGEVKNNKYILYDK